MLLGAKRTNLALEDTLSCLDAECKPSALGNVTENKEHPTPAASVLRKLKLPEDQQGL